MGLELDYSKSSKYTVYEREARVEDYYDIDCEGVAC